MKILITVVVVLAAITSSCYYDSEEALFPQINVNACDTSKYTYSGQIQPMLSSNCYSCHSGSGTKLKAYSDVVTNAAAIYGSISHASGYSAMPQGGTKINDCYITQFKKWMDAGKLNN